MRRGLSRLAFAAVVAVAGGAAAEDFCPALDVPEVLDLECRIEADGTTVVAAADTPFGTLNRLRVRRLEAPVDDPERWLREQMTLDTSGLDAFVRRWAQHPDNPIKPDALEPSVDALAEALRQLEQLSRTGCEEPRQRTADRWSIRCTYDAGIAEGVIHLELRQTAELPVAVDYRATSEQRQRQFEALVNGLRLN